MQEDQRIIKVFRVNQQALSCTKQKHNPVNPNSLKGGGKRRRSFSSPSPCIQEDRHATDGCALPPLDIWVQGVYL